MREGQGARGEAVRGVALWRHGVSCGAEQLPWQKLVSPSQGALECKNVYGMPRRVRIPVVARTGSLTGDVPATHATVRALVPAGALRRSTPPDPTRVAAWPCATR